MVHAMWMRGLWIGKLFLILFLLTLCSPNREFITIKIAGESFHVEVARTQQQQSKGLMSRKTLGEREGMLFAYSEDRRLGFWMKDTSIPLSIAFVNRQGEIIQIEKMKPFDPTTVRSKISVRYALEVLEGTFERLGVKEGDRVEFPEGFM
jgi:uncharacterized membrane protein (UPF0127 family)